MVRVLVTSIDGNFSHPFRRNDTVGDVHEQAYKKIIKDENATPYSSTSIEFKGSAENDATVLASLLDGSESGHGKDVDLVLALTWVTQGG